MKPVKIAEWSEAPDRKLVGALVGNIDLVIVRWDDNHSVLYGRCLHKGAMLADGHISGTDLRDPGFLTEVEGRRPRRLFGPAL